MRILEDDLQGPSSNEAFDGLRPASPDGSMIVRLASPTRNHQLFAGLLSFTSPFSVNGARMRITVRPSLGCDLARHAGVEQAGRIDLP